VEFGPVGFYIGARAFAHRRLHLLSVVILAAGTVGALTVIVEFLVGHKLFADVLSYQWNQTTSTIFRPGGIFGGPPQAGEALCFVLFFGLAAASGLHNRRRRLAAACIAVTVIALILTFTRADLIAAAVGVLAYLWLVRSPLLRARIVLPVLATAGVVFLLVLPSLRQSTTIQEGFLRAGTLSQRYGYWTDALPIATSSAHNFIFGAGTGLLEVPVVSQSAPVPVALAVRPQAYSNSLHSQYVTTLVEEGMIGVAAVILVLVVPLLRSARVARAEGHREYAAVCASLISVAIVMSVDTAILDGVTFAMMMTAAGIAATAGRRRMGYS
ncbi:MAG TPA: O-antigen ligase family protein, partial [Chloroflexota bacterium]